MIFLIYKLYSQFSVQWREESGAAIFGNVMLYLFTDIAFIVLNSGVCFLQNMTLTVELKHTHIILNFKRMYSFFTFKKNGGNYCVIFELPLTRKKTPKKPFKGHAIIARARGRSLGTGLIIISLCYACHWPVILS